MAFRVSSGCLVHLLGESACTVQLDMCWNVIFATVTCCRVIVLTLCPHLLETVGVAIFGKFSKAETEWGANMGWVQDAVASMCEYSRSMAKAVNVCLCVCVYNREVPLFSKSGNSDCKDRYQLPLWNSFHPFSFYWQHVHELTVSLWAGKWKFCVNIKSSRCGFIHFSSCQRLQGKHLFFLRLSIFHLSSIYLL